MISNGIYSLIALAIDGVDVEVGGVLILLDGKMYGGDPRLLRRKLRVLRWKVER